MRPLAMLRAANRQCLTTTARWNHPFPSRTGP
jgi:hypothetical protein